jgi:lipid-A-disaccharide synthase
MKYYIIAGEASGDLHGSNLMNGLVQVDPSFDCRFWGGDMMTAVGGTCVQHYRDTAIMGFIEVVKNLRKIRGFFIKAKHDILVYSPDVIIFVDYPGFNLRMAEWAKSIGFQTVYYITPTVWAWNKRRVHKLKKYIDLSIPILPFEKAFLDQYDVKSIFVGHPLVDAVNNFNPEPNFITTYKIAKPILALLPGSRTQEIKRMLPTMIKSVIPFIHDYQIIIAGMSSLNQSLYDQCIEASSAKNINIPIVNDHTYDILNNAKLALVSSGTATLEAALFNVPQVVCYIGSSISVWIAKKLLTINFISLPNLIMDKKIVTELIQDDCNPTTIKIELDYIISHNNEIKSNYNKLLKSLGNGGASSAAAIAIYELIRKSRV